MASAELIVDGTNLAWAWPRTRTHLLRKAYGAAQRVLVEEAVRAQLQHRYRRVTFVFDGPPPDQGPTSQGWVRVLYPGPGQSADQRIVELVESGAAGGATTVATSDRGLKDLVRRHGAATVGGMVLLQELDPTLGRPARPRPAPAHDREKPSPSRADTDDWLQRFQEDELPTRDA